MKQSLILKENTTTDLGLKEILQSLPKELLAPNVYVYYIDLILFALIGNVTLVIAAFTELFSAQFYVLMIACVLSLYRISFFIHETTHCGKKIKGFNWTYNLLHGFLHKLPSYAYTPHLNHHNLNTFGTEKDPEYEKIGGNPIWFNYIFLPLVPTLLVPFFLFLRWGILPIFLPFIGPTARNLIYKHGSSIVINIRYTRDPPTQEERLDWYVQDLFCGLYTVGIMALLITNILPLQFPLVWYMAIYFGNVMNVIRGNLEHKYYTEFKPSNQKQVVLDSITIEPTVITKILFPIGLNFHALHHMVAMLPYHNLEKVHHWLLTWLPKDHPYRVTITANLYTAIKTQSRGEY
jgi:fatty acid desaturase